MKDHQCRWERRPDERPAELLQAALKVFGEKGYASTRLDEVARAAGVSKATVYHYFDGKEDLLRQAVRLRLRSVLEEAEGRIQGMEGPASVKLRAFLRGGFRVWRDPQWGQVTRLVLGLACELPGLFELWAREGALRAWSMVEALIEEGKRTGEFRPDTDAKAAARLMVSGLSQQVLLQEHFGIKAMEPCDMERMLDSGLDLFLAGLRSGAVGGAS